MARKVHIGTSPLTGRIYSGHLMKSGDCWAGNYDVTGLACGAVAEHVIFNQVPVIVTANGKPKFKIIVEDLGP